MRLGFRSQIIVVGGYTYQIIVQIKIITPTTTTTLLDTQLDIIVGTGTTGIGGHDDITNFLRQTQNITQN